MSWEMHLLLVERDSEPHTYCGIYLAPGDGTHVSTRVSATDCQKCREAAGVHALPKVTNLLLSHTIREGLVEQGWKPPKKQRTYKPPTIQQMINVIKEELHLHLPPALADQIPVMIIVDRLLDLQPYPTPWAYGQAVKALNKAKRKLQAAKEMATEDWIMCREENPHGIPGRVVKAEDILKEIG